MGSLPRFVFMLLFSTELVTFRGLALSFHSFLHGSLAHLNSFNFFININRRIMQTALQCLNHLFRTIANLELLPLAKQKRLFCPVRTAA